MPKSKSFQESRKKPKSQKDKPPETADEWLAAGVEMEESAEKWRAGDAAKSTRFFQRAISDYDTGLGFFPRSFDLAYNKARVQFQLTQYPTLLAQLSGAITDLLREALNSHRYALGLATDDADCLFNTAQVLAQLAEHGSDDLDEGAVLALLDEAVSLQQRCLDVQKLALSANEPEMEDEDGGVSLETDGETSGTSTSQVEMQEEQREEDDRWATVIEPVTADSVLDTAVAILETLASMCEAIEVDNGSRLQRLERAVEDVMVQSISPYLSRTREDRRSEAALAEARTKAALLDVGFRVSKISLHDYDSLLKATFGGITEKESASFLTTYADVLVDFDLSVADVEPSAQIQWDALTRALDCRSAAAKTSNVTNSVTVHMGRGDIELRRRRICDSENLAESLRTEVAKSTLAKNATIYYKGAANLAQNEWSQTPDPNLIPALVKRSLAQSLIDGNADSVAVAVKSNHVQQLALEQILKSVVDDLLMSEETLHKLGVSSLIS